MSPLWEDIKKKLKEGVTVAAEKTEEYTKIGKVKVEILNINRNIDKTFTNLGREVYTLIDKKKGAEISKNKKVIELVTKIKDLKTSLAAKEAEIEAIKQEASSKGKEESESSPAEQPKKTGTQKTSTKETKK